MAYSWNYQVHLRDTDAAGVVYFANFLALCHNAYEAALFDAGISFQGLVSGEILLPVIHASGDFKQPLLCGNQIQIQLQPHQISDGKFDITYEIHLADGRLAGIVTTVHVAIDRSTRQRANLPLNIQDWLSSR
jgi:1,4-dihydroxy-2-naphthoyl-CoA hydrolase